MAVAVALLPRRCPRPAPRTPGCAPSRPRSGPTSCSSSSTTSRWTCCRPCAAPGPCARGARRTRTRSSSTRLCCVSRASTFTGQYPHQTGVRTNVADPTDPADPRGGYAAFARFGNRERTVAVRLQAAGYTTGYVGKYLNQYEYQPGGPPAAHAARVGRPARRLRLRLRRLGVLQHPDPRREAGRSATTRHRRRTRRRRPRTPRTPAPSSTPTRWSSSTPTRTTPRRTSCRWRRTRRTAGSTRCRTTPVTRSSRRPSATGPVRRSRGATAGPSGAPRSPSRTCPGFADPQGDNRPRRLDGRRSRPRGTGTRADCRPRPPSPRCATGPRWPSPPTGWSPGSSRPSARTPTSSSPRTTASTSASRGSPLGKGTPYTTDTRVPLLVVGPGVAPGPRREMVSNLDLAPTLEALAGLQRRRRTAPGCRSSTA